MTPELEPQSRPSAALPPLLALPTELQQQILSNLYYDASDPTNPLTLMILRRTHKSFRAIIPNPWKKMQPTMIHFLTAEQQHPYLFPFVYDCACRPLCHFGCEHGPRALSAPCYECLRRLKNGDKFVTPHTYEFASVQEGRWRKDYLGQEIVRRHFLEKWQLKAHLCFDCWIRLLDRRDDDVWY